MEYLQYVLNQLMNADISGVNPDFIVFRIGAVYRKADTGFTYLVYGKMTLAFSEIGDIPDFTGET